MTLIEQLIKEGVIDEAKASALEFERKREDKTEEEIILESKIVSEPYLMKLKSKMIKVPIKEVVPEEIPLETLKLIPENSAVNFKMIPLSKKGNIVEVGMVYPENTESKEALRFIARQGKFNFKVFLISPSDFDELIKQYRTLERQAEQALEEFKETQEAPVPSVEKLGGGEEIAEEAPIVKMVSVIIKHAVEGKASDIHIEPTEDKLKVRYRLDGVLYTSLFLPLRVHPAVAARIKILSRMKIDETRIPQDGRFTMAVNGKEIDFRVSSFPTINGEKIAIRVLDPTEGLKTYKDLGLTRRNFSLVEKAAKSPYGLILSTGPTGSGKTTTLYALLRLLNKEQVNIVTVEDPVEYSIEGINQSQIKPEIGYTFAQGLRNILRQDPDIVMVGEIRDEETANLVTHAALTGHLVLSTLHTNNAIGVIPRLMDMGIRAFLLPSTLTIAIAQRLVRELCPHCKKKTKPNKEVKEYILEQVERLPSKVKKELKLSKEFYIYEPQGCERCNFKGYTGRTGIFEVLEMTDALAELLLERKLSKAKILEEARSQEMITMEQDGILKVLDGVTTVEEIIRVARGR